MALMKIIIMICLAALSSVVVFIFKYLDSLIMEDDTLFLDLFISIIISIKS